MFPIRDHNPSLSTPYVTWLLMAANVVLFLLTWPVLSDYGIYALFDAWGVVPARISAGSDLHTVASSMFLHAGWLHLAGNMLFLWIFGDNLEDVLGHLRFLAFYLLAGTAAAAAQVMAAPWSPIPMVGASGAIAGVLGAYLVLFPKARVDVLIIIVIFFRIIPFPAWLVLGIWFGMQVFGGLNTMAEDGGVAFWAHAGGFVAGVAMILPVWLRRGGPGYWARTHGAPPHPEARYKLRQTSIPPVRRR